MKSFNVYQSTGGIRTVDLPMSTNGMKVEDVLEFIFNYGQNEFQPKSHPSVSVGDLIAYNDDLYCIEFSGFSLI